MFRNQAVRYLHIFIHSKLAFVLYHRSKMKVVICVLFALLVGAQALPSCKEYSPYLCPLICSWTNVYSVVVYASPIVRWNFPSRINFGFCVQIKLFVDENELNVCLALDLSMYLFRNDFPVFNNMFRMNNRLGFMRTRGVRQFDINFFPHLFHRRSIARPWITSATRTCRTLRYIYIIYMKWR